MSDENSALQSEELQALLSLLDAEQTRADVLMDVVIPIGVALAYESDWNHLLRRIVTDAMRLCNADGGFICLIDPATPPFKPVLIRVDSLGFVGSAMSKQAEALCDPSLQGSSSARAARTGQTVSISDVQEPGGETCEESLRFDRLTGYQTHSCLAVPLRGQGGQVIGVLPLVNSRRPIDRQTCPF